MYPLDTRKRNELLHKLESDHWDLVVIGGGITGAGILLDAVSRGMKVALVEMRDFAWGTSSRSTKLIHGGLRYLKQFEIGLVHEVGKERAIAHRNARHIVRPEKMLLPMYKGGSLNKFSGSLGLWVYDIVAGVKGSERRTMLGKTDVAKQEPLLKTEGLTGAGLYYEYRTDDARLTIEVIKTAAQRGGLPLNYLKCYSFQYDADGKINGIVCEDKINSNTVSVSCDRIINAAGPWVDTLRLKDGDKAQQKLFLSNGLHLVVSHERLPIGHSMYFDVEGDSRMIFAIVRGDSVYLGTTDVKYDGDINDPTPTAEETQYILDATNSIFPSVNLGREDIISTWSGLRPLIYQEGKSASELSRKDEIFVSESGLVSIAGGKLTGYRKMAIRAVDESLKLKSGQFTTSNTDTIKLSGCNVDSEEELHAQIEQLTESGKLKGIPAEIIRIWHSRYGVNTGYLVEHFRSGLPTEDALMLAELEYCSQFEMAVLPEDFTLRRTAMEHFERTRLENGQQMIEEYFDKLASMSSSDTI